MGRDLGCVLLILGTCVGAAMLALPVVTAYESYWVTAAIVFGSWVVMSIGAWALLRVNNALPLGTNLLSMARSTVGRGGYWITWIAYLMLLYSLICAYLAGSSDVIQSLLSTAHVHLTRSWAIVLTTGLLAAIVFRGISSVDWVNRGLMLFKLMAAVVIMLMIVPHTHTSILASAPSHLPHTATVMVILCSFGFAIILPSIRVYLQGDKRRLRRVMCWGSILPLIIYLVWIALIQASIPRGGAMGLLSMNNSADTNSLLMQQLAAMTHSPWLRSLSRVFVSICALTAFLGVSMCLMDFLADGLQRVPALRSRWSLTAITYVPPLVIVLLDPGLFTSALAYAGMLCVYLLIALPIAMYFIGRKRKWNLTL